MTHECDRCRSDLRDDIVTETDAGERICQDCVCDELAYSLWFWGDEYEIGAMFGAPPQRLAA